MAHATDLHLRPDEAAFVATICRGHRRESLTANPMFASSYPDTQFLAAIVRIADELDITAARTPRQLLELVWKEMDAQAKWHWVKHWCVPFAQHNHLEQKEPQKCLILTYHLVLRLPNPRFPAPFLETVLAPIRRTLRDEDVELILERKSLKIGVDAFQTATQFDNHVFGDQTTLEDRLMSSLALQHSLSRETLTALSGLRGRLPAPK
jgi:hypothetical protein